MKVCGQKLPVWEDFTMVFLFFPNVVCIGPIPCSLHQVSALLLSYPLLCTLPRTPFLTYSPLVTPFHRQLLF